jgi:hypothetical protein
MFGESALSGELGLQLTPSTRAFRDFGIRETKIADSAAERSQFELSGDFVIVASQALALKVFHHRAASLTHQVFTSLEGLDMCPESSNVCVSPG